MASGYGNALDDATRRDHELSLAHMDEASLKLGIEMSLAEALFCQC